MRSFKLSSGYDLPAVGLGTWQSKPGEVEKAVVDAIKAGYRHIDCAYIYGNEKEIGCALTTCMNDLKIVKREELFVTSKLWNTKHHPCDVLPALKESLTNLNLDYLDLYLIHWPISFKAGESVFPVDSNGCLIYDDVDHLDTWKELEKCVKEGLARSIGVSNFNSCQIQNIMDHSSVKPSVNQIEVHPFLQQEKLVEFCKSRNIVVTAYSSFGSPSTAWIGQSNNESLLHHPTLTEIGASHGKTPAQVILRWLNQRGIASIPKSSTTSRIVDNFKIFDFELSGSEMQKISKLNKNCRLILPMVERDGVRVPRDEAAPHYPYNIEF